MDIVVEYVLDKTRLLSQSWMFPDYIPAETSQESGIWSISQNSFSSMHKLQKV